MEAHRTAANTRLTLTSSCLSSKIQQKAKGCWSHSLFASYRHEVYTVDIRIDLWEYYSVYSYAFFLCPSLLLFLVKKRNKKFERACLSPQFTTCRVQRPQFLPKFLASVRQASMALAPERFGGALAIDRIGKPRAATHSSNIGPERFSWGN